MAIRPLARDEVPHVWSIDRSETIERIYHLEDGRLVARPEHHEVAGWPPGEPESYGPRLLDCFDHGGFFYGAFEAGRLQGAVVLEGRFMGRAGDQLQLTFLHVGRARRRAGLGRALFEMALAGARELGARTLYVSATPSENTVQFYLHLGFRVTDEVDPALFELEPDDIHMTYEVPAPAPRSGGGAGPPRTRARRHRAVSARRGLAGTQRITVRSRRHGVVGGPSRPWRRRGSCPYRSG